MIIFNLSSPCRAGFFPNWNSLMIILELCANALGFLVRSLLAYSAQIGQFFNLDMKSRSHHSLWESIQTWVLRRVRYSRISVLILSLVFTAGLAGAQPAVLPPGFDADEYADVLWLAFFGFADSLKDAPGVTLRKGFYARQLRTAEVGLFNQCELYLRSDSVLVLSLRGTIKKAESWMENFYAGMLPATGSLQLASDYRFDYKLAQRPDAMIHAGWTIGTGFLAREYLPVLQSMLVRGLRKIIITGHSQGGALSYLNASLVHYLFKDKYPDLQIKTYASAAPKPGNLYYAYDFEHISGTGFAYRIVNADDWVPESPVSIQAVSDFNPVNPIAGADSVIKKQKFPDRVVMKHVFNKMRRGSEKAARRYQKYLGDGLGKLVKKSLPGFVPPDYADGSNYMTAGSPIILMPDTDYYKSFMFDGKNMFLHHMYAPYMWLLKKQYGVRE